MVRAAALTLAILASPLTATAAEQFDLICKGEQQEGVSAPKAPHEVRYRFDLVENRWCEQACERAFAIQEVTADLLVLEKKKTGSPLFATIEHAISRTEGRVSFSAFAPDYFRSFHASCEPAPFSGMPKPKF